MTEPFEIKCSVVKRGDDAQPAPAFATPAFPSAPPTAAGLATPSLAAPSLATPSLAAASATGQPFASPPGTAASDRVAWFEKHITIPGLPLWALALVVVVLLALILRPRSHARRAATKKR